MKKLISCLFLIGCWGCTPPKANPKPRCDVAYITTQEQIAALVSEIKALRSEIRDLREDRELNPLRLPGPW